VSNTVYIGTIDGGRFGGDFALNRLESALKDLDINPYDEDKNVYGMVEPHDILCGLARNVALGLVVGSHHRKLSGIAVIADSENTVISWC